jgi:hypothetical protein
MFGLALLSDISFSRSVGLGVKSCIVIMQSESECFLCYIVMKYRCGLILLLSLRNTKIGIVFTKHVGQA